VTCDVSLAIGRRAMTFAWRALAGRIAPPIDQAPLGRISDLGQLLGKHPIAIVLDTG
jgi:hypothetical protein